MAALIVMFSLTLTQAHAQDTNHGTYFVKPSGEDTNTGKKTSPFKTINKAASIAQPGDTIIIYNGLYRERVDPLNGGTGENSRIIYKAAEGEVPVIKGSEEINNWTSQGNGIWMVQLQESFFQGYNPYKLTIQASWLSKGGWNHRGDVYLNGLLLQEQQTLAELQRANSWYTEGDSLVTRIYANFGTKNPNTELAEINVRHSCFYPRGYEKNYITVDGLHLMHAATRWAPPGSEQVGVIGPNQARNWIIQNCIVEYGKTAGISIGGPFPETPDFKTAWEKVGRHIIRNNIIRNCGQTGVVGYYHCFGSIIESNLIEKIHLDRTFTGAEPAGIKLHIGVDITIRNNIIRDVDAQGIWVDFANQGWRISGNVFQRVMWNQIHFEQNHGPILVDNNIFIGGPDGNGKITFHGTDAVVMAHNLFFNIDTTVYKSDKRTPSKFTPHTGNRIGGFSVGISNDIKSYNNIFINKTVQVHDEPGCKAGNNLYYNTKKMAIDSTGIAENFNSGFSYQLDDTGITIEFSASNAAFNLICPPICKSCIGDFPNTGQQLEDPNGNPMVVDKDIFGNSRNLSNPRVGPFEYLLNGKNVYRFGYTPFNKVLKNKLN